MDIQCRAVENIGDMGTCSVFVKLFFPASVLAVDGSKCVAVTKSDVTSFFVELGRALVPDKGNLQGIRLYLTIMITANGCTQLYLIVMFRVYGVVISHRRCSSIICQYCYRL